MYSSTSHFVVISLFIALFNTVESTVCFRWTFKCVRSALLELCSYGPSLLFLIVQRNLPSFLLCTMRKKNTLIFKDILVWLCFVWLFFFSNEPTVLSLLNNYHTWFRYDLEW